MKRGYIDAVVVACLLAAGAHAYVRLEAQGKPRLVVAETGGTSLDDAQFMKGGISEFCNGDLLVMAEMLAYVVKEHEPVTFTTDGSDHALQIWQSPQLPKSPSDQIKDLQAEIKRLTEQAEEDKRRAEAEARRRAHEDDVRGRFQKLLVRLQAGSACP